MVASAAQRNQKRAAGAITLLTAGFCAAGILGIDGIGTKLKSHNSQIHITPKSTCSQRKKNATQACWPLTDTPPDITATSARMTTSSTKPAITVRPNDWKMAPMDDSSSLL